MNTVDPTRWKARTDAADAAERSLGQVLRAMGQPEPLSAAQLARVRAGLDATPIRVARRRWTLVMATGVVLGLGTLAFAAHLAPVFSPRPRPAPPVLPAPESPHHTRHAQPRAVSPSELPVPAAPPSSAPPESAGPVEPPRPEAERVVAATELPTGAQGSSAIPRSDRRGRVRAVSLAPVMRESRPLATSPVEPTSVESPAPAVHNPPQVAVLERPAAPAESPSPAPGEAKWLAEAIRHLRRDHAPGAALAVLDEHATALARSSVAHEALLVRVETLLVLGRRSEVLALLDATPLAQATAAQALLLTRGELRAAAGRCREGVGDFDLVLARQQRPDERALYGRALCRDSLGDHVGGRADLARLRQEFPHSPRLRDLEARLGSQAN